MDELSMAERLNAVEERAWRDIGPLSRFIIGIRAMFGKCPHIAPVSKARILIDLGKVT